jgi:trimeric autotransporter adhesin
LISNIFTGNNSSDLPPPEATGLSSTAVAAGAVASGNQAVAFGQSSIATGMNSTAIGHGAAATADQTTAIGQGASASAASASAFGQGAQATATNAVAIGAGSVASAPNTVSVGSPGNERRITNVAPGIAPTDAATVGQVASIATGIQSQVNRVNDGVAVALAAGGAPSLQPGRKFAVALNYGNFNGSNAMALSSTALLHEVKAYAVTFNAGVGWGMNTNVIGTRAGVSLQW